MSSVNASGPLWVLTDPFGCCRIETIFNNEKLVMDMYPDHLIAGFTVKECRIIPGHGKVVPVELVESVKAAMEQFTERCGSAAEEAAYDAIEKALEGAM